MSTSILQKHRELLAATDLLSNNRNRVLVCLCIDTSRSMMLNGRMDRVNNGVRKFIQDSQNNVYAAGAIDLCIVTFGGQAASIHQPFTTVKKIEYHDLTPDGGTPLGAAVEMALDAIHDNQQRYQSVGISCYKPWLIIMSDGVSDDDVSSAAERVQELLRARKLKVKCIDMSSHKEDSDLKRFTLDGSVETISGLEIEDFFDMLSRSAAGLSTEVPGEDENTSIEMRR